MRLKKVFPILLTNLVLLTSCTAVRVDYSDDGCARIAVKAGRTIILPMSDDAPEAMLSILGEDGMIGVPWTSRFAIDDVDYSIPYTAEQDVTLCISGLDRESVFYRQVRFGKREDVNPAPYLHFKPAYGWINDPNGMVYKDGEWHLYFQWNPFGALWGNMSWGHAVSRDLLHWEHRPLALAPDSLGAIFSGSAVVKDDKIVAMYTSSGPVQTQSIAVSEDGGNTFVKHAGNPVLRSGRPDFRDPKLFWYEPEQKWCVAIAAGDAIEIYSSEDMYDWHYESRFGEGVGCHGGVWECPDLFPIQYDGAQKWVMIVNCNRNEEIGSATQYFIGTFDGHSFVPDDTEERWLDYGRDHYAGVTWSNAPDNRRVLLAWMSNWQYANRLNTKGYRGMMTTPRELSLAEYDGKMIVRAYPVQEVIDNVGEEIMSSETVTEANPVLELSGMTMCFDFPNDRVSVVRDDRNISASVERRPSHTVLTVHAYDAIECFIDDGAVCMTFLTNL